jgi:hypothetical protein
MLKGTSKNALSFHSLKSWLILFSVVAGIMPCLTKRGTSLHYLKHPLLRFSTLIHGGYHGEKGSEWFLSKVKLWGSSSFTGLGALPCTWLGFGLPCGTLIPINMCPLSFTMHKSFAIIIDFIRLSVLFSSLLSYTVQISIFMSGPTTTNKMFMYAK